MLLCRSLIETAFQISVHMSTVRFNDRRYDLATVTFAIAVELTGLLRHWSLGYPFDLGKCHESRRHGTLQAQGVDLHVNSSMDVEVECAI